MLSAVHASTDGKLTWGEITSISMVSLSRGFAAELTVSLKTGVNCGADVNEGRGALDIVYFVPPPSRPTKNAPVDLSYVFEAISVTNPYGDEVLFPCTTTVL